MRLELRNDLPALVARGVGAEVLPRIRFIPVAVPEDAEIGFTVGTALLSGSYEGTPTWALSDDADGLFAIDESTGEVTVADALDYETATFRDVTLEVSGVDPAVAPLTRRVHVTNVDDWDFLVAEPDAGWFGFGVGPASLAGWGKEFGEMLANPVDGHTIVILVESPVSTQTFITLEGDYSSYSSVTLTVGGLEPLTYLPYDMVQVEGQDYTTFFNNSAVLGLQPGPYYGVSIELGPSVPAAFTAGMWQVLPADGAAHVIVNELPDDGGSEILDIEYRLIEPIYSFTMTAGETVNHAGYSDGTSLPAFGSRDQEPVPGKNLRYFISEASLGESSITFQQDVVGQLSGRNVFVNGIEYPDSVEPDWVIGEFGITIKAWEDNNGPVFEEGLPYFVDLKTPGFNEEISSEGIGNFSIADLVNEKEYSIQIRAVNAIGAGPWSDVKTVTPVADAPPTMIEFLSQTPGTSVGAGAIPIQSMTGFAAGNIAIIFNRSGTSGDFPYVYPFGEEHYKQRNAYENAPTAVGRAVISAKVLTGTEADLDAMNAPDGGNFWNVLIFKPNGVVTGIEWIPATGTDPAGGVILPSTNPPALTIPLAGETNLPALAVAHAAAQTMGAVTTDLANPLTSVGQWRGHYEVFAVGDTPANRSYAMTGTGANRTIQAGYLRFTFAEPDPLSISGTPLTTATVGEPYEFFVTVSGGTGPYAVTLVGDWPAWADVEEIEPGLWRVFGEPDEEGSFSGLIVRATDDESETDDLGPFGLEVMEEEPSFSPLDLPGLNRWYDPSDAATVTLVSDVVSQLNDKSGNGLHVAQGSGANRPGIGAINGRAALLFDGSNDFLFGSTGLTPFTGDDKPFSLIMALDLASDLTDARDFFSLWQDASGTPVHVARSFSNAWNVTRRGNSNDAVGQSPATNHSGNPVIFSMIFHGTTVTIRVNGDVGTNAGSLNSSALTIDRITIGAFRNTENFFWGHIGEIILCEGALDTEDVEAAEAYLAERWGITL